MICLPDTLSRSCSSLAHAKFPHHSSSDGMAVSVFPRNPSPTKGEPLLADDPSAHPSRISPLLSQPFRISSRNLRRHLELDARPSLATPGDPSRCSLHLARQVSDQNGEAFSDCTCNGITVWPRLRIWSSHGSNRADNLISQLANHLVLCVFLLVHCKHRHHRRNAGKTVTSCLVLSSSSPCSILSTTRYCHTPRLFQWTGSKICQDQRWQL